VRHHCKDGFRWHHLVLPAETNEARTAYVLREAEWIEVAQHNHEIFGRVPRPLVLKGTALRPELSRTRVPYTPAMTYVISSACLDVTHQSCVQACPADCTYEGAPVLYINPDECVDCRACKLICEEGVIYYETDLPEDEQQRLADNAAFFSETLPGRGGPIGSPGGADTLGPVGVDTPFVAALPPRGE